MADVWITFVPWHPVAWYKEDKGHSQTHQIVPWKKHSSIFHPLSYQIDGSRGTGMPRESSWPLPTIRDEQERYYWLLFFPVRTI